MVSVEAVVSFFSFDFLGRLNWGFQVATRDGKGARRPSCVAVAGKGE